MAGNLDVHLSTEGPLCMQLPSRSVRVKGAHSLQNIIFIALVCKLNIKVGGGGLWLAPILAIKSTAGVSNNHVLQLALLNTQVTLTCYSYLSSYISSHFIIANLSSYVILLQPECSLQICSCYTVQTYCRGGHDHFTCSCNYEYTFHSNHNASIITIIYLALFQIM